MLANNQAQHGGRCQLALPGTWTTSTGATRRCLGVADCVHHVHGKEHGDELAGLVAACTPCNLRIGEPGRPGSDPPGRSTTRW